jgi:hypothetical protein
VSYVQTRDAALPWTRMHRSAPVSLQVLTSKDEEVAAPDGTKLSRTQQAKALLTQYGSAYLLTSITLAAISFTLCYFAVDAGLCRVDRNVPWWPCESSHSRANHITSHHIRNRRGGCVVTACQAWN